jgi:Fe-S-cluster-containing dehydrogenase component/DMSO reductase anchor subunit
MLLAQLLLPLGMPSSFLDQLLEDQSDLTAVERFSKSHDALEQSGQPVLEKHYRDLIPKDPLRPGQQYAFEVNLDACTGCKACVVGCHHMNGLDETETWRKVDLLKGADPEPTVQHLTSACHHCIDPGCMTGCPVQAYEKDETTGVVAHLDDQCIGCRYCELKCPYEVPQYSESLGIVRKCDMCIGRLQEGEAPACVQSCPNEAIKITAIEKDSIISQTHVDTEMPGNPSSSITYPSTQYVGSRASELINTESTPTLAHAHMPLAIMLPLTQVGFGLITASIVSSWLSTTPLSSIWGALVLFIGLAAAPMHLGSPKNAWKAFLGARTSWLSREMLAFGPFAGAVAALVAIELAPSFGLDELIKSLSFLPSLVPFAVLATGAASIYCSAMIYIDTPRPLWKYGKTLERFIASVALGFALGCSGILGLFTSLILLGAAIFLKHYFENAASRNTKAAAELAPSLSLIENQLAADTATRYKGMVAWLIFSAFTQNAFFFTLSIIALVGMEILERRDFFRAGIAPRSTKGFSS